MNNPFKNMLMWAVLIFGSGKTIAQISAERYSAGVAGGESIAGAATYMYDIGGLVVNTAIGSNGICTQGFEQSGKYVPDMNFLPPNSFSPDGDGINDTWILPISEGLIDNNKVAIFTRWGDIIAEFTNYNNQDVVWNGTFQSNGESVPVGTYFYIVESDDRSIKFSGWVYLIR